MEDEEEYQRLFQTFFKPYREVCVESKDEEDDSSGYDEEAVSKGMDIIYQSTRDNALWVALYEKAAASFLSEDPEVGLPVLLAYPYLRHFIALYHCFLEKGAEEPEFLHNYELLMHKFSSDAPNAGASNAAASSDSL
jgi:hypothetical protein